MVADLQELQERVIRGQLKPPTRRDGVPAVLDSTEQVPGKGITGHPSHLLGASFRLSFTGRRFPPGGRRGSRAAVCSVRAVGLSPAVIVPIVPEVQISRRRSVVVWKSDRANGKSRLDRTARAAERRLRQFK